jgi:hypothetical protein
MANPTTATQKTQVNAAARASVRATAAAVIAAHAMKVGVQNVTPDAIRQGVNIAEQLEDILNG